MALKSGKNKRPLKRLSARQLREELVAQSKARPIVLDEREYREWLDHTVVARIQRAEKSLDLVKQTLIAAGAGVPGRTGTRRVELALREINNAVIAFQYSALKFNIMYRPAIDGSEALNVVLWPSDKR